MQTTALIDTIETHTAGMPTRIVLGGWDQARIAGGSVAEQRERFVEEFDWLREFLMNEPRGHEDMYGVVLVPPGADEADLGIFYMNGDGYAPDMSGHGTIGVVTALVETGQLDGSAPIRVETPAGVVTATTTVADGEVESVTIESVPTFVYRRGVETQVPTPSGDETVTVPVDVVYGGIFFVMADVGDLDLSITPDALPTLIDYGIRVTDAAREQVDVTHPFTGEPGELPFTYFYEPLGDNRDRNLVVGPSGDIDRSPTGTATAARMAHRHDAGELGVGERYHAESVIGTRFEGEIRDAETKRGVTVITPELTGSAHVIAKQTFIRTAGDPIRGFSGLKTPFDEFELTRWE